MNPTNSGHLSSKGEEEEERDLNLNIVELLKKTFSQRMIEEK